MLYSIDLTLLSEKPLSVQMSSLFHGVMMEQMAANGYSDYIDELHQSVMHEYSTHLEYNRDRNEWHWIICCLNERAYKNIWENTLSKVSDFVLERQQIPVRIISNSIKKLSEQELSDLFKGAERISRFELHFNSPVSFKSSGSYVIFPEVGLILKSLISRYDLIFQQETLSDPETFDQLCANCRISGYRLKSTVFHLEGVKIPAFIGDITLRCNGTATMANFLNMLLTFGTFSGIGVKTSIGMGSFSCQKIIRE